MAEILSVRTVFEDENAIDQMINRRFYTLHIPRSEEYPFGRKGKMFVQAWKQLKGDADNNDGMLVLDGDVAIDPHDYKVMLEAIHNNPQMVHTAPVKIWPISTKRPDWVWGHATEEDRSQVNHPNPKYFSFCFTYLPKALIRKAIEKGWKDWNYPGADKPISELAYDMKIPVNVVNECRPKHMNY